MIATFLKTEHILTGEGEYFDPNWFDSDTIVLPPKVDWDYQREMQIEDVYIWEKICEPWEYGVYAAWDPNGEFYILRKETNFHRPGRGFEVVPRLFEFEYYYGAGAQQRLIQRMDQLGILRYAKFHTTWVEPEKMWLYA